MSMRISSPQCLQTKQPHRWERPTKVVSLRERLQGERRAHWPWGKAQVQVSERRLPQGTQFSHLATRGLAGICTVHYSKHWLSVAM